MPKNGPLRRRRRTEVVNYDKNSKFFQIILTNVLFFGVTFIVGALRFKHSKQQQYENKSETAN
jgi:hypothetical protein